MFDPQLSYPEIKIPTSEEMRFHLAQGRRLRSRAAHRARAHIRGYLTGLLQRRLKRRSTRGFPTP